MSNVESGGSGKMNKKSNEGGGFNDAHNKNRNGRHPDKSGYQYRTGKFREMVQGMFTLGVKNV